MKLLTKELPAELPHLYSQEERGLEGRAIVKFFTPDSNWTWYAIEGSLVDEDGYYDTDKEKVDFLFFGWVYSDFSELGYFSLNEMEQINVGGLGMERDLHFTSTKLSEVKKLHQ